MHYLQKALALTLFCVALLIMPAIVLGQEPNQEVLLDEGGEVSWGTQPGAGLAWNTNKLSKLLEQSNLLQNITAVRLDGVSTILSGNMISLHNLRVESDSTTLDDYLQLDLLFDASSFQLPIALTITEDLGLYVREQDFFTKDVSTTPVMTTPSNTTLASDQLHLITPTAQSVFSMNLETGTVLTFRLFNPTADYELQIDKPDGTSYMRSLYKAGSRYNTLGRDILQSGLYTFRFVPQNEASVSLEFGFSNNNRTPIQTLATDETFSTSLSGWGYEYAKYGLDLQAGDLLEVSNPSDPDVWLHLLNSNGRSLG